MNTQVVIIGAGPAGAAAAISCRLHGLHVLMITGKKQKGDIPKNDIQPSESIHPGIASILAPLNAAHCIGMASRGLYDGIETNGQYNPLGQDENGKWQGHHISRPHFDAAMLQSAIQQGVSVLDDTVSDVVCAGGRVTGIITAAGIPVHCLYVIDASGQKRIAGRKLRVKEAFYSPPLVAWTGVCKTTLGQQLPFDKNFTRFIPHADGWTWLAPESDDQCTWTRLEIKGKQHFLPPTELDNCPLISKIKTSNRRWRIFRPVCKEGLLLCGDAAGIIDPAAGQGILSAIISAVKAAGTVHACISNPAFEALYLARYNDWYITDYEDKVRRLKHFYDLHGITVFEKVKT